MDREPWNQTSTKSGSPNCAIGYLELCVLETLQRQKCPYGFQLLQLFEAAGLTGNAGTLYPLLTRMHNNGWLDSTWQTPEDGGHPRRFYSLSKTGKKMLPAMLDTQAKQQQVLKQLGSIR